MYRPIEVHPDYTMQGCTRRNAEHFETTEESIAAFVKNPQKWVKENEIIVEGPLLHLVKKDGFFFVYEGPLSVEDKLAEAVLEQERVLSNPLRLKCFVTVDAVAKKRVDNADYMLLTGAQGMAKRVARTLGFEEVEFVGDYALKRLVERKSIFIDLPARAKPFRCFRATTRSNAEVWLCVSLLNGGVFIANEEHIPQMEALPPVFGNGSLKFSKHNDDWTMM